MGSFNDWSRNSQKMEKVNKELFILEINLEPKKYEYKYIVSGNGTLPTYTGISSNDINFLETEVKDYDPILALDGGNDGLNAYRSIIPRLKNLVKSDGKIFFEIGRGQENSVSEIALQHGLLSIDYKRDLSNIIRVIVFNIK